MINIFCTRKTETFVSVNKKVASYQDTDENWCCNLIIIDRKKALYFIEKKTLYSVLLLNLKKKDLENIETLFIEEFINQLKNDAIFISEKETIIRNKYKNLTFYETDNDQKTLGTLRDNDYNIKAYLSDKADKLHFAKDIMYTSINRNPLGGRKYHKAKDLMKAEIENFY